MKESNRIGWTQYTDPRHANINDIALAIQALMGDNYKEYKISIEPSFILVLGGMFNN